MTTCEICFNDVALIGPDGLCQSCHDWGEYWNSLTDEQQRAELAAMDAHANERDR